MAADRHRPHQVGAELRNLHLLGDAPGRPDHGQAPVRVGSVGHLVEVRGRLEPLGGHPVPSTGRDRPHPGDVPVVGVRDPADHHGQDQDHPEADQAHAGDHEEELEGGRVVGDVGGDDGEDVDHWEPLCSNRIDSSW